jgi:phosphopentomutase
MAKPRAIVIVCDSLGVGELPDAKDFGDEGSNTLGHVLSAEHPSLPTLARLGLLHTLPQPASSDAPQSAFGRMNEVSAGKDTTTGHWEMMGLVVADPFRTYPNGFPPEVIAEYERRIGRKTLGNKAASGTVILDELGEEHMRTGSPIVYTSADSVFQVAAHEEVIPVEELWRICAIARELMRGEHNVGRIIARPFVGPGKGQFKRTANRKDFSVRPTGETVLERAHRSGKRVVGLGKIADIFDRVGIGQEVRTESNSDGMRKTIELLDSDADFIFTNLVDFDSKYGHRNDARGYAKALETFDGELAALLTSMREDDLLFITADHGCDPCDISTDHTREYVPMLIAGPRVRGARPLGTRSTFSDLGVSICDYLGISNDGFPGRSALEEAGVK